MKNKKSIKIISLILALLVLSVIAVNSLYSIRHEMIWRDYYSNKTEATENGFNDEYSVCTREKDVFIDGKKYSCFRAYRKAILDGDYVEYVIVASEDEYRNKTDNKESLIVFGKKLSYVEDSDGNHYTFIDAYSVDDFPSTNENELFKFAIAYSLICAVLIFIFIVALIIELIRFGKKRKISVEL